MSCPPSPRDGLREIHMAELDVFRHGIRDAGFTIRSRHRCRSRDESQAGVASGACERAWNGRLRSPERRREPRLAPPAHRKHDAVAKHELTSRPDSANSLHAPRGDDVRAMNAHEARWIEPFIERVERGPHVMTAPFGVHAGIN